MSGGVSFPFALVLTVAHPDFTERLLRRFLLLCENPRTRRRALALVRGSVGNARAGRRFYALVNRAVLNPVARVARGRDLRRARRARRRRS